MPRTIGNPFSWTVQHLGAAGRHASANVEHFGGDRTMAAVRPHIRDIGLSDLREALRLGARDTAYFRADVLFVILLYPIMGIVLALVAFQRDLLPMLFPLASGFALVGPVAALGLYEMSRRREAGQPTGWSDAFAVLRAPSLGAILLLSLYFVALFFFWLLTADMIYEATLGPGAPASVGAFLADTFTTAAGWTMIAAGLAAGFVFAAVALAVGLVSFPLLLDRDVGVPTAIVTSVRVTLHNPRTVAVWGLIVAALLVLGTLPAFLGLILVLPVLGHGTWHLYRRAVAWD
ncbi:MAG: DUF2189 domain-containing protein [Tranquillimonas sp.]